MPTKESYLPNKKAMIFMAWIICLVVTLDYSYDFFIRAAPGVMAESLKDAFKVNSAQIGWLSSAYFISYTIMQVPAGIILDKYNRKFIIGGATFLCILGNYLFSATNCYEIAFIGRILMGVGSAFGFIGAAKVAAMWLPRRFFSSFISFTSIVGILGGLVTETLLSSLVHNFGWKEGNSIFTYFGIIILVLVFLLVKDNTKFTEHFKVTKDSTLFESLNVVIKNFTNSGFWAASLIGAALFMPINVLGSLWGVGFIQSKYLLSESSASYINSFLFIGTAIGFGIGSIISTFTTRYRLILTICILSLTIISIILLYTDIDLSIFMSLYFLLGVMSGGQALSFSVGKSLSPRGTAGSAVAGINLINNIVPVILLPLIGHTLIAHGTLIKGTNIYTVQSFRLALTITIVLMVITIPLVKLLPKHTEI